MALSREAIFEKVRSVLVEALGVEDDEVSAKATLRGDLGAESIDYLDIVFKLQREFDIEIPRGDLFPDDVFQNEEYVKDGKVTEAGMAELKQRLPHADLTAFEKNPVVSEFGELFTVDMIVSYIEQKLSEKGE
jgi:acyl carrier protein